MDIAARQERRAAISRTRAYALDGSSKEVKRIGGFLQEERRSVVTTSLLFGRFEPAEDTLPLIRNSIHVLPNV